MIKVSIEFETDSDAFESNHDGEGRRVVQKYMKKALDLLSLGGNIVEVQKVLDENGNSIGRMVVRQ